MTKSNNNSEHTPFLDPGQDITIKHSSLIATIYDKRDDFSFPIVNFPFLDGDIPQGCDKLLLIPFAQVCSDVSDFSERNLYLSKKKNLNQGYR